MLAAIEEVEDGEPAALTSLTSVWQLDLGRREMKVRQAIAECRLAMWNRGQYSYPVNVQYVQTACHVRPTCASR